MNAQQELAEIARLRAAIVDLERDIAVEDAAIAAISSPLLEFPMAKARRVVFSVVGGPSMTLQHVNNVAQSINEVVDSEANIIFGATVEDDLGDELIVTVVATDFPDA